MNRSAPAVNPARFRPTLLTRTLRGLWSSPRVWGVLAGTLPGLAAAGPLGEQVVSGDVAVSRPDGSHTVIDQGSAKAIVNWQQFSIAGDEYVQFNQPGSSAVALNRVVGGDISNILGSLTANGQVFLVNPQGVYFGPNATVDVGGLVASILDIRDEDFLAGRYTFSRHPDSPEGASVVNDGYIRAHEGGYVVLAGDYTGNTGVVEARLGQVVLASGNRMTLDMAGDGLVSFAVDEATLATLAGVENSGELLADGGRVVMTAQVAGDLMGTAVNNAGLVRAHSVTEHGGEIWLTAAGGDIENSGTLDANGESGEVGGAVRVLGEGDIELPAGGAITARGDGAGGGGMVRVVADERLAFRLDHGIDVRGGAPNTGGFVEVSGHQGLQLAGTLKLGGGRVIIDPEKIHIVNGGAAPGGSYGSTGTASISKGWLADLLNGDPETPGADVYLIASQSITMESGGVLDGRPVSFFTGGDLHLIIGSPSDIGSLGGAGSYGVYSPGLFNLNSTDATASIALNDNVLLGGDLVAVTGQTVGGIGIGTIEVRDVSASQVFLGSDNGGGNTVMTESVKAGTVTVFNGGNGMRVLAEDTVELDGIVSQFGDVLVTTGSTAANRSITVTGGITADRLELGTKPDGTAGTNARAVTVGGDISTGGSAGVIQVTATDLIELQGVTLDGAEGATALIIGAAGATVMVADVAVRSGSGASAGSALVTIQGNDVTTGDISAEGYGAAISTGAAVDIIAFDSADVGSVSAIAYNGHTGKIRISGGTADTLMSVTATRMLYAKGLTGEIYVDMGSPGTPVVDLQAEVKAEADGTGNGFAEIHLDGGEGNIVSGKHTVLAITGANDDAYLKLFGRDITTGDIEARALGAVDISVNGDVAGAGSGNVVVGDLTIRSANDSASVSFLGNDITTGNIDSRASWENYVNINAYGVVDLGGMHLEGSSVSVDVATASTAANAIVVNGLVEATASSVDLAFSAAGGMAFNADVQSEITAVPATVTIAAGGTVTVASGVTINEDGGSSSGHVVLDVGGLVNDGTISATGGGGGRVSVVLNRDGAAATGTGLLDADEVEISGGSSGTQSNLSVDLRTRTDNLLIGNNDDSDHWASVMVENQSRSGVEVQITTNGTNTFDDLTLMVTGGDARHNEVFKSAGNFELDVGEDGSNYNLNVVGNTYRVDTIGLNAMGNIEAEGVTISADGGGFAGSVNINAGDEGAGNAFNGVLNLGGATIEGDAMELFSRGNLVLAANVGGAVLDGNQLVISTDLGFTDVGDIVLTDAAGYGVLITARRHLAMAAEGSIRNNFGDAMIQADALAMLAGEDIALGGTRIYVGDGVARDNNGDPLLADAELISTLQQNAGQIFTDPEPASTEINAFFRAGNTLTLGQEVAGQDPNGDPDFFTATTADDISAYGYLALQLGVGTDLDGDGVQDENNKAGYLWLEGKVIDLGPVVGEAANIIVQWATPNDLEISAGAAPDAATQLAASTTYLTVPDHFSRFTGTTHAPGYAAHPLAGATPAVPGIPTDPYAGNVNITGSVNLGSANFFLLTGGSATGLTNIQTTGLVGLINVLAGPEEPPPEEPPPEEPPPEEPPPEVPPPEGPPPEEPPPEEPPPEEPPPEEPPPEEPPPEEPPPEEPPPEEPPPEEPPPEEPPPEEPPPEEPPPEEPPPEEPPPEEPPPEGPPPEGPPPEEPPPEEPPPEEEPSAMEMEAQLEEEVDSEEGDLDELTDEETNPEDPKSPETNTDGDKALARVCQ